MFYLMMHSTHSFFFLHIYVALDIYVTSEIVRGETGVGCVCVGEVRYFYHASVLWFSNIHLGEPMESYNKCLMPIFGGPIEPYLVTASAP